MRSWRWRRATSPRGAWRGSSRRGRCARSSPGGAARSARRRRGGWRLRGFGGGAYTAEDLFRFARALRAGKLLGGALADTVTAGRVDIGVGAPVRYGFGFYEQRMHGARVVGHPGSNPDTGHDADVQVVWDGDWTVVVLSNYDAPAGMELEYPILDMLARQTALAKGAASPATGATGMR